MYGIYGVKYDGTGFPENLVLLKKKKDIYIFLVQFAIKSKNFCITTTCIIYTIDGRVDESSVARVEAHLHQTSKCI